jgi:hypothetical protein
MIKTYQTPIQPNSLNVTLLFSFSLAFAFVTSILYGILIATLPVVYFNFFITLGFGIVLGYSVRILSKILQAVNRGISIRAALLSGLAAYYFQWVVYILFFVEGNNFFEAYFTNPTLVFKPWIVAQIMMDIHQVGDWAIGSILINGWPLTIIWIIEFVIIVLVPAVIVKNQPISPFSTRTNSWYRKFILHKDFESIALKEEFTQSLISHPVKSINALKNGSVNYFSRVSIFYHEEDEVQYVSVQNVRRDKTGKKEMPTDVVHLLEIKSENAKQLMDNFHAKKAFFFDY